MRPVVERGRVKVGTIWPEKRACLLINRYPVKHRAIPQRAEQLTFEQRAKVDRVRDAILKGHRKSGRRDLAKCGYPTDSMFRPHTKSAFVVRYSPLLDFLKTRPQ